MNFDGYRGADIEELWERVRALSSLWASISSEFRDVPLPSILLDWQPAID